VLRLAGLIDRFANFTQLPRKRVRQCGPPRCPFARRLRRHSRPAHDLHKIPLRTSRKETGEEKGDKLELL